MEVIEKNIQYTSASLIRPEVFHFYALGDIHGGALGCAEDKVKKKIMEIRNRKNAYVIGMGDYLDCIVRDDKRFSSGGLADWMADKQDDIIETQRKWVVDLFGPIKDKIICLLVGNHEETIHEKHQDDIGRHICDDLGVPYAGYQTFINLIFDRKNSAESHRYTIHAWHGDGAAQTEGARLMRLMRLVNDVEAHVYLMGHLHAMTSHTPDRLVLRGGKVKSVELQATVTGSWLKGYTQSSKAKSVPPSYIEKRGYKPSRIGCPIIHIAPSVDIITIES